MDIPLPVLLPPVAGDKATDSPILHIIEEGAYSIEPVGVGPGRGPALEIEAILADVTGQLAASSRRIYTGAARHFADWLRAEGLTLASLNRSDFIRYRVHLEASYSKSTAARLLVVARRLLDEGVKRGELPTNSASGVKGFKASENETTHRALTDAEARELLATIDTTTAIGQRDYALIYLLLRTGLRRSEVVALNLADLQEEQGHHIAVIRHGKGDKRRIAKLPVPVVRAIKAYAESTGHGSADELRPAGDVPLFVGFDRWNRPVKPLRRVSDKLIERVVVARAKAIGIDNLTPHGLRASFVTLCLEAGAPLHMVQYWVGHSDPRTTERYQRRKLNLDNAATDYLKF